MHMFFLRPFFKIPGPWNWGDRHFVRCVVMERSTSYRGCEQGEYITTLLMQEVGAVEVLKAEKKNNQWASCLKRGDPVLVEVEVNLHIPDLIRVVSVLEPTPGTEAHYV